MIEHHSITVKFICDRGVSHEIVRHRVGASYAQESTRYCNYSKDQFGGELTYIEPTDFYKWTPHQRVCFRQTLSTCEDAYMGLLRSGLTAQEARAVLPNALKTEIVVTMTLRAWRHFFQLRCAKSAHPDIRVLAIALLSYLKGILPEIFGDIEVGNE
jgi:thymidylate synthase (FAD)